MLGEADEHIEFHFIRLRPRAADPLGPSAETMILGSPALSRTTPRFPNIATR